MNKKKKITENRRNSKKLDLNEGGGMKGKGKSAGNRCAIGIDDRSGPIKTEAGVIEVRARNKGETVKSC